MAKKSLAEQISELSKPKTDFDIENHDFDQEPSEAEEGIGSEGSDDEESKREHYVASGKSKLRKENQRTSLGERYEGSVTSRDKLYDFDSEESGDGSEESDGSEKSDEESDEESDKQTKASKFDNDSNEEVLPADGSEEQYSSDSGASLRENSNSEVESEDDLQTANGADISHKRAKLKDLMASEHKQIVGRLSQASSNDAVKGYAVMQQQKIFDSIIDCRLKAQKALSNSNQLPINKKVVRTEKFSTSGTKRKITEAKNACFELLHDIFQLRKKMIIKDSILDDSQSKKLSLPRKRTLRDYLKLSQEYDDILQGYRASVLTKWSAKIHNSSGSSALEAGKFKSINQSAEQQVINNLADMDRLIKRTRLNRRQVTPLGYDTYLKTHINKEEENADNKDIDIPSEPARSSGIDENNLIFDDDDFYRVLLNDLVDKKIHSASATSGMTIALKSAQLAQKTKTNIDTKASKGRKLRYHVQEPIANFEVPHQGFKWNDDQIDEFFASLLGQKVNMNESDEDSDNDDENDDSDILVRGEDSIKLFG